MAEKKKTGLFIAGGLIAFVLIGGGIAGAAVMGLIKIPGLTPNSKSASLYGEAAKLYGEGSDLQIELKKHEEPKEKSEDKSKEPSKDKKPAPKTPPAPPKAPPEYTTDPDLGAKKIATVWNSIKPDKLAPIVEEYNDKDLALIFNKMDAKKVATLLAELEPKRAALISKQMQTLGSVLQNPTS